MAKKDFTLKFDPPRLKTNGEVSTENTDNRELQPTEAQELEEAQAATLLEASTENQNDTLEITVANEFLPEKFNRLGNPFLQTRENFDPALVIKTGYKMRIEYKQMLKMIAEMKRGYTIEALLDDALTMYLSGLPEAQTAINLLKSIK